MKWRAGILFYIVAIVYMKMILIDVTFFPFFVLSQLHKMINDDIKARRKQICFAIEALFFEILVKVPWIFEELEIKFNVSWIAVQ